MPKLRRPPKKGRDGNYAVVYADGKKIRLGRWDSEEADINYRRFVAEWAATGVVVDPRTKKACLVDELFAGFLTWGKDVYGKSDYGNYKTAVMVTLEIYSGVSVEDFGPVALLAVQNRFVERGYAREYCNKLTGFVRRIFRWGVIRELVPLMIADSLKYVPPLLEGQTIAPDPDPREDVPDEVVEMTLPFLLPTIADMIRIQRLAVMRPSEVCRMRVGDIKPGREKGVWIYTPRKHKGKWRKHCRVVALSLLEMAILKKRMAGKGPDDFIFSPKEALEEKRERDAARRKTKVQPSQVARREKRAATPKRKPGDFYDSNSYRRCLTRTIERVNKTLPKDQQIPHWTPYQLRHSGVTELTETDSLDVARAVAGQKSLSTAQRYNHADRKIAEKAAKKRSKRLGSE